MSVSRRYEPKVHTRKVKKPLPPPERPFLYEMVIQFSQIAGQPVDKKVFHEAFYRMSQNPRSPMCIRELLFDTEGKFAPYPFCPVLDDTMRFLYTLQAVPATRIE